MLYIFEDFKDFGELDMLIREKMEDIGAKYIANQEWVGNNYQVEYEW